MILSGCSNPAGAGNGLLGPNEATISNEQGFPIGTSPITLTAIVSKNLLHGDFNEMPSIMQIEEKAGITLDFVQVPSSSYGEKLNLIFASGDLPDMVFYGESNNLMNYAEEFHEILLLKLLNNKNVGLYLFIFKY